MFDDDPSLIEIIHASLLMNKPKQFIVRYYLINKKSIKSRQGLPTTQSAFTCLKLAIETLEQGVKYVQG